MAFTLLRDLPGWGAGLQTTQLGGEGFWKVKGTQSHTDNCKYYCDRRNLSEAPVGGTPSLLLLLSFFQPCGEGRRDENHDE